MLHLFFITCRKFAVRQGIIHCIFIVIFSNLSFWPNECSIVNLCVVLLVVLVLEGVPSMAPPTNQGVNVYSNCFFDVYKISVR